MYTAEHGTGTGRAQGGHGAGTVQVLDRVGCWNSGIGLCAGLLVDWHCTVAECVGTVVLSLGWGLIGRRILPVGCWVCVT